jgi:hypothetical protein
MPTQVVKPSVSRANFAQGIALMVFVEIPSLSTTSKPVCFPGNKGLPGFGLMSPPGALGVDDGGGGRVTAGGLPAGACCAMADNGNMVSEAAAIKMSLRIEASLRMPNKNKIE